MVVTHSLAVTTRLRSKNAAGKATVSYGPRTSTTDPSRIPVLPRTRTHARTYQKTRSHAVALFSQSFHASEYQLCSHSGGAHVRRSTVQWYLLFTNIVHDFLRKKTANGESGKGGAESDHQIEKCLRRMNARREFLSHIWARDPQRNTEATDQEDKFYLRRNCEGHHNTGGLGRSHTGNPMRTYEQHYCTTYCAPTVLDLSKEARCRSSPSCPSAHCRSIFQSIPTSCAHVWLFPGMVAYERPTRERPWIFLNTLRTVATYPRLAS